MEDNTINAQYAFIKNGQVINIIILDNPTQEMLNELKIIHNIDEIIPIEENVVIGSTYDGSNFILPFAGPYPSWIFNEDLRQWVPPIAKPDSGLWQWNEDLLSWVEYDEF